MTKFNLNTYLMISVLIIVSGILWILFVQIDTKYDYPTFSSDFVKEQNDIIQKVYQTANPTIQQDTATVPAKANIEKPLAVPVITSNMISSIEPKPALPVVAPSSSLQQNSQYNEAWDTLPDSNFEDYNLRNNPWSPYYKSGY